MADIAMCADELCPKREKCYRATAIPHPTWQAWFAPERDGDNCDSYWPTGAK